MLLEYAESGVALIVGETVIPYQFFLVLLHLLTIAAMVVMSRRNADPKVLLKPFRRGDRI